MQTLTVAERPDLAEPSWEQTRDVLPEYNNHGDVLNRYWGRLTDERPEFQFHVVGDGVAPVRPNWKERYPLVAIERYAGWRRGDGLLFDPWMRVHERLGATILKPEPRSLRITGTIAEWEQWTEMPFPDSGDYWFPAGLTTVTIERERDRGAYWEPNVWMRHPV